jgi:crossover junction endodeoxyribonuclease RuvC
MIIIGIDPGYATVGYGIVDYQGNHFRTIDYGTITTPPSMPFSGRLAAIYNELS